MNLSSEELEVSSPYLDTDKGIMFRAENWGEG